MKPVRLIATVVVAAVAVSGCGSAGYTQRDFIVRANAICASALRETRSIAPGTALPSYLTAFVPVLESEQSQLRALRRPPATAREGAILRQYFSALSQTVAEYRQLAAAARSGEEQAVTDAEAALSASPVDALATHYGMSACGTPGSTAA